MTDSQAILSAILADPDDDVPRLVFADWLEENGQCEWAEFIRVQIESQSVPRSEPHYKELTRRARKLLAQQKDVWLLEFQNLLPGCQVQFERGFVSIVKATYFYFFANAHKLWTMAPVREVQVTDAQRNIADLCWLDRPPHVRVRADMMASIHHLATVAIDALAPNPTRIEPFLRSGTWLILGSARGSGPDIVAMSRFSDYVLRKAGSHGNVNFAVRPYQVAGEFRTWCSAPIADRGPHWLLVRDGQVVSYSGGIDEAEHLDRSFWAAANR